MMRGMKLIALVEEGWGVGYQGKLLVHIPEDLRHFKEKTTGQAILLGRKTLDTFPRKEPLPHRTNLVLSRNRELLIPGATICHSLEEVLEVWKGMPQELYVAGGADVYEQCMPYCNRAYITKLHKAVQADAFLPNLDENIDWEIAEESPIKEHNGLFFSFVTYRRKG